MLDLINDDVFNSNAEVIVIPISSQGAISHAFIPGLKSLIANLPNKQHQYRLGDVLFERTFAGSATEYIAFACTVTHDSGSSYATIRSIGIKLGIWTEANNFRTIASPLLGTGGGGLNHFESHEILLKSFYENSKSTTGKRFDIYTISQEIYDSYQGRYLDIDTASITLALRASLNRVLNDTQIGEIRLSEYYYYQLAQVKFHEYRNFKQDSNFFYNIKERFKRAKVPFSEYLPSLEQTSSEFKFLKLCGELIAYIDYRAYLKNLWNEYPDKRVLAKSAVKQTDWIINLLTYKETDNLYSINASSIFNALIYLYEPAEHLTMLSEGHRKLVFKSFLNRNYEGPQSLELLFYYFQQFEISIANVENRGALISRILYFPWIKSLWLDSTDQQNEDLLTEPIPDGTYLKYPNDLVFQALITKQRTLDLGRCGLTDLNLLPDLFNCTHLEELILSNEWGEFENGKWHKRTSVNKGPRNILDSIPPEIKRLKNLKKLICGGDWNDETYNQHRWSIQRITFILNLKELEYLNVSNNQIQNVPNLKPLKKLKVLHLNNNNITKVGQLDSLINLQELYLSNNQIKDISFLKVLKNIRTIDLHANNIRDLTTIEQLIFNLNIMNSKWHIDTINIAKNPLEKPPLETVVTGKEAVLRYFIDIRTGDTYINKDVKIILVGNSEAGKTTLAKYLDNEKDLNKKHSPTHWMEEREIESKYIVNAIKGPCTLRLFDFGGHDYFHDTHHLFYGTNTIYILLWEATTNHLSLRVETQTDDEGNQNQIQTQDYPIKYWLDSVKHFIKEVESDNFDFEIEKKQEYTSSLLVLQNKVSDSSQIVHLNNQHIHANYSFVFDFLNISILEKKRNLIYLDAVITEVLNNTQIIGAKLPKFYGQVKDSIKTYTGKPVIGLDDFMTYCNSLKGVHIDIQQTKFLVSYLKQIGIILWYPNGALKEKVYIRKKWVIENIYKALEGLIEKKGEFGISDFKSKMRFNDEEAISLLNIMIEFKIIFRHPHINKYIAPLYLPEKPTNGVNLFLSKKTIPYRRFIYSGFIQKNVVLSLFQKYGQLILNEENDINNSSYYYWKNGLIIKDKVSEEIVMIAFNLGDNEGNAHIDVYNIGKPHEVFIKSVIDYINEINNDYKIEEMVTLEGENYISVDLLNEFAEKGKLTFTERRSKEINESNKSEEIIFKLKDYQMFLTKQIKKKKVVISYSKKDLVRVHTFIRYLKPLVDLELIEDPWYCTYMNPADDWDIKIKHKFLEADVVFFMVSEYFYSTHYIIEKEIKTTIDRYNVDQSVKIVPVILEHYEWARKEPYNLQRFSAVPYQAKPISDFNNEKLAWSTITESVKSMLEKDLDPAKIDIMNRSLQEIYERQVSGKLDKNS